MTGGARVIVSRAEASVPGCPNWSYAGQIGAPITTDSNYGCAMNSNIAAMVADPRDLVLGQRRTRGGGDAATASKAIKAYRDAVPTGTNGLKETITRGGK
jgi:pilus assembly protein CpaD